MLVTAGIAFECLIVGFMAGGKRGKLFTEDFMNNHFGEVHNKELKANIPKGGYPDCGNGLYSDKLSYKDWFEFNLDQRAHKNFLEALTIVCFMLLACGVVYPTVALVLGCIQFVARAIFVIGYRTSPKSRIVGGMLSNFSFLALMIATFWGLGVWIKSTPFV